MSIEFDQTVLAKAIVSERWTALTRSGVDVATLGTWNRVLPHRARILVPIDVQAFVATAGGERIVGLTGGLDDPPPFSDATEAAPGVHLHWALPDALLSGVDDKAGGVAFAVLPDRWTVIRTLFPEGRREAIVTGWVIDARTATVVALPAFSGTFSAPIGPDAPPVFEPLDAAFGGSLTWTASRAAAADRFALHDPLTDLAGLAAQAPAGFHGRHAVYTVAGWWDDLGDDPLAASAGTTAVDRKLADLGWIVTHDHRDEDGARPDPAVAVTQQLLATQKTVPAKFLGTGAPARLDGLDVQVASPVADAASLVLVGDRRTFATLLHGAVMGVPIDGVLGTDARPSVSDCSLAMGVDTDDVVAALAAPSLAVDRASREGLERLTAAFTSNMLDRLATADGIEELNEREHEDGFWSFPGAALPLTTPDRLRAEDSVAFGPTAVGRKGRGARAARPPIGTPEFTWQRMSGLIGTSKVSRSRAAGGPDGGPPPVQPPTPRIDEAARSGGTADARIVPKPAPRLFRPRPPMLAIRGARPDHRHHGDRLFDDSQRLFCRYASQCQTEMFGVVTGAALVPSLGSGALPDEVLTIVREAVLLNPYAHRWVAAAGAGDQGGPVRRAYETRLAAEVAWRYGSDATYDGSSHLQQTATRGRTRAGARAAAGGLTWDSVRGPGRVLDTEVSGMLATFSLLSGTAPSPLAISTWHQPWVPMWIEWQVTLRGDASLRGWTLDGLDLKPQPTGAADPVGPAAAPALKLTYTGRSPLGQGAGQALQSALTRWVAEEQGRRDAQRPTLGKNAANVLASLGTLLGPIDMVSASLDGLGEQLLGIPYVGVLARSGPDDRPDATALPTALFGGTLRLDTLRVIDAFGRVLDLPTDIVATTTTLAPVPDDSGTGDGTGAEPTPTMMMPPRFQHAARWLFRLVDPAHPSDADPAAAKEAFVDQLAPELAVNPVAGFLLPDHIDEALEVFSVRGEPLGQIGHDPVSAAVTWEPAPGRPVPPDAGPHVGIAPHDRFLADVATGLVVADVRARVADPSAATLADDGTRRETSLTAFLRAVDTTLWTIDTYAALGTSAVSSLTGRPIAVVRATLRLDVPDDVDDLDVLAAGGASSRRGVFAALAEERVPVRLGELHRSDDSLLGFFVDDDYAHFHVVDKVVAAEAFVSGRHQGHLGQLGSSAVAAPPATAPIHHEYVVDEDTLWVRPGQVLRLTLLMLPAGKVHLTSGVLPRKAIALADDWVTPGLTRLAPSVRIGPVLVDPTEIRLPLVHTLGDDQTFTRRTGPLTWRDDPIVAATQTAYLPTLPHEAQEGWIRVTPKLPTDTGGGQ